MPAVTATSAMASGAANWAALQQRFGAQRLASLRPELLVRAIIIQPLPLVAEPAFMELGAVPRSLIAAKDLRRLASLVQRDAASFVVLYVGDVHQRSASEDQRRQWVLISHVPSACSAAEVKDMANKRAVLRTGLGASSFAGDVWCSSPDQITLSNYYRWSDGGTVDGAAERNLRDAAAAKLQSGFRSFRRNANAGFIRMLAYRIAASP